MKNLATLATITSDYEKSAAALAHLESLPTTLEAERDKLVSDADLASPPSSELAAVATKLQILPTKIEQARKTLAEIEVKLVAANEAFAAELGKIAIERDAALRVRVIEVVRPLISNIQTIEGSRILNLIIGECDDNRRTHPLHLANSGAYSIAAISQARKLLALQKEAGL